MRCSNMRKPIPHNNWYGVLLKQNTRPQKLNFALRTISWIVNAKEKKYNNNQLSGTRMLRALCQGISWTLLNVIVSQYWTDNGSINIYQHCLCIYQRCGLYVEFSNLQPHNIWHSWRSPGRHVKTTDSMLTTVPGWHATQYYEHVMTMTNSSGLRKTAGTPINYCLFVVRIYDFTTVQNLAKLLYELYT